MLPVTTAMGERRRVAKASMIEEDKENINGGRTGGGDGSSRLPSLPSPAPGTAPASRLLPLSDAEEYTGAHLHHHHSQRSRNHSPQPFLPEIVNNNKYNIADKLQRSSSPQLTHYLTYASGHGGSVEHWKKLARKAELEMHLEQEQHKSDREKDLDAIHRLRCRTSALEAAAQDRDAVIEKQRRKINFLKAQLGGVNKRFGKELSILRNQSEQMQVKITSVTGANEKKILELREDLQLSESKRKLLEHQLILIYKCIEDPLEKFNLTELHEGAPESVWQGSIVKVSKKCWRKPGLTDLNDGTGKGFDNDTMPRESHQGQKNAFNAYSVLKRRLENADMAEKVLRLRSEKNLLSKQVVQQDEKVKSLLHESGLLKKQLKEAISSRNSAISQVRETERLFDKLEAIESLIVKAGIVNDQDLNAIDEDRVNVSPPNGACKSADMELKQSSTYDYNSEVASDVTEETKLNTRKISRKQSFRKWGTILNKIRSALVVFVSKVHATSQLESKLKLERESINVFAHKLKQEVLVELDPRNADAVDEMEKLHDQVKLEIGKRRDVSNSSIDKELFHKILMAVREQKRKYLVTASRVEDLKKEKLSSEANLFNRQRKVTEQERKLAMFGSEQEVLHCYIACMHKILACIDQDDALSSSILELKSDHKNMMVAETLERRYKVESLLKKVQFISKERDQLKAVIAHLQEENQELRGRLMSLRNSFKFLDIAVNSGDSENENLNSHLKQMKARKDELEMFYQEASTYHNALTSNLQILERIISGGVCHENVKPCGIEPCVNKGKITPLIKEPFVNIISRLPDLILQINYFFTEYKELESRLQNVELRKKHAEDKVLGMEQLGSSLATLKNELETVKRTLKDIHCCLTAEDANAVEPELLSSTIIDNIQKLKAEVQLNSAATADSKQKSEEIEKSMFCCRNVLVDVVKRAMHLKKSIAEETKTIEGNEKHEQGRFADDHHIEMKLSGMALSEVVSCMETCLEEIQQLRTLEKMCAADVLSKLKQELEEELSKHSEKTSNQWNERIRLLSEEIAQIQAEKETLAFELSASSKFVNDLQITIQGLQKERITQVGEVEKERDSLNELNKMLTAEIQNLKLQNQQQSENAQKQVEALEMKLLSIREEHSGSVDSVEEIKQVLEDERSSHKKTLQEWKGRVRKLEDEKDSLGLKLQSLETTLKEKDTLIENMVEEIESLKQELERVTSGSSNEVIYLQTLIKEKDQAETKLKSDYTEKVDSLEKEILGLQHEKMKLANDVEQMLKASNENEILFKKKLKELEVEVLRLGGVDINDEVHKSRRQAACERLRDFFAKGSSQVSQFPKLEMRPTMNPLRKFATFQVDLLVNSKAHKLLEVSDISGGLSHAAIHYFSFNQQLDDVTFENGNLPGPQSSNMLAELVLLSTDNAPIYETKTGDVLGLSVKVKGLYDRTTREILCNTNVIRTDEIMEAIKDQPLDNFSLWPDLVSSWKWERSSSKGWILVCIKWRFLFKNIFPEISEALQILSIKQGS